MEAQGSSPTAWDPPAKLRSDTQAVSLEGEGPISPHLGVISPQAASQGGAAETVAKHRVLCAYCVLNKIQSLMLALTSRGGWGGGLGGMRP